MLSLRARSLMVDPERLELPTSAFEAHCSIQLSYGSAATTKVYLPPHFLSLHPPSRDLKERSFVTKGYVLRS